MVHTFIRTQRKYIQVYQMDSSFILWLACWKNNPVELGDFWTALSLFTSLQYNTKAKDVDIINHLWQRSSESPSNQNQLKQVKHHQTEIVLSHNLVLCSYKWQCQKSILEKSQVWCSWKSSCTKIKPYYLKLKKEFTCVEEQAARYNTENQILKPSLLRRRNLIETFAPKVLFVKNKSQTHYKQSPSQMKEVSPRVPRNSGSVSFPAVHINSDDVSDAARWVCFS